MRFTQGPRHYWVSRVPEWRSHSQGKSLKLVCRDTHFYQLHLILEAVLNKNGQRYECPSDCYSRALQRGQLKYESNAWKGFCRTPVCGWCVPTGSGGSSMCQSELRVSKGICSHVVHLPAETQKSGKPNRLAKSARQQ